MPSIVNTKIDFIFGLKEEENKVYYRVNIVELRKGVTGYDLLTRQLDAQCLSAEVQVTHKDAYQLAHQLAVENRPEAIDILSAPKLNACQFVLMRSKQRPHLVAMAHIAPMDDLEENYRELCGKFSEGDELDVVCCGLIRRNTDELSKLARERGCTLNSSRTIPFNFEVETFVTNREPKSVYLHYVPADDNLIIYSDSFSDTNKPAMHMAQKVFNEPSAPIVFHQFNSVFTREITKKALSSAGEFSQILPVLTDYYSSINQKPILFTYESCPDAMAPNIADKKQMALGRGFDFQTTDGLLLLKLKEAQRGSATGGIQVDGEPRPSHGL